MTSRLWAAHFLKIPTAGPIQEPFSKSSAREWQRRHRPSFGGRKKFARSTGSFLRLNDFCPCTPARHHRLYSWPKFPVELPTEEPLHPKMPEQRSSFHGGKSKNWSRQNHQRVRAANKTQRSIEPTRRCFNSDALQRDCAAINLALGEQQFFLRLQVFSFRDYKHSRSFLICESESANGGG